MPTKAQLQADLKRVRAERDSLSDDRDVLRIHVDSLRADRDTAWARIEELEQQLADCQAQQNPQPWRPYNPDSPFNKPIQ